TLPVLFIMISNHYPMTYGNAYSWAVLAAIIVAGVLVRHFFNLRHKGQVVWALPIAAAVIVAGLAIAIAPRSQTYVPLKQYTA
ncbi:urate hydroxylase PuuD, partial [Acinetobacter baumannii]